MSNEKTLYLETGSTNPYYNLAFEEYVLNNRREGNILILWQNHNTIVVGQNQNTEAEINRHFVEEHRINVIRRSTGGGAVYHDMGNLNYSFISDSGKAEELTFTRFTTPIVNALESMGAKAEASGRNDILIEGHKVSGTAQRVVKGRVLHHGTLLYESNPDMVAGALNVDPEKFRSKSAKSVRSRIGNIKDYMNEEMTLGEFWDRLRTALTQGEMEMGRLTDEELKEVLKLKEEKYDTWEWNYGRSPKFDMQRKRYWDGGVLEVLAAVDHGYITEMKFYGDFLAVKPLDVLVEELKGKPFTKEALLEVLEKYEMTEYFGGISLEEVISTVFED